MSWTDQNELLRLGKKLFDATGTSIPSEKSMISQLASSTGVAYHVARDAYVKSVLDPLLQEKVRKSMNWMINNNFIPEFVDGDARNVDLDDTAEAFDPSSIKADNVQIPRRMFNLDTETLEDYPSGQYVILSHSWKGQEISFPFISNIKEAAKQREMYEMIQDDPDEDEEARRFARFQAKKFKHLEGCKNDIELLRAQCTKDLEEQTKKIETILSHSGITSNTRKLLAQLAEFKEANWGESSARNSRNAKKRELELRKMADKVLEKEKKEAGVDDSHMPKKVDEEDDLSRGLAKAEKELAKAEEKLSKAEEQLTNAKTSCATMNQNATLRSAVEDLLPVLERKKSMIKIERSMREAKRILGTNLFPSHDQKRYLWNDTCCINKGDANELTLSLAMMGEWYNNADFCLVHLDTPESTEWVSTWDQTEVPNFSSFDKVSKPKWSTRGWTLQELVLSKMTFYVNNIWQPLTRPAEGLGPYYFHCAYLKHHIRDKDIFDVPPEAKLILQDLAKLQELMDTNEIPYISYPGCSEKSRRLIGILDFLGVRFPGDMDNDNANAHIRNSISLAAYEIESRLEKESPNAQKLKTLFTALKFDRTSIRTQARNLIKLLVRTLVEDCSDAIDEDRERVSEFTNVPPSECCRGLGRSSHPANDILSLASYRECTVPIDRVYSLMGVLGVKFAAFHAEGPTKALTRLLDEVLITTNDVSIFNWAGKDLGSPIGGRSLYPSNLTAYGPEKTESYFTARRQDVLARASKEKRYGLQDTASRLTVLLRRTIDFVKTAEHETVPIDLIENILEFIKKTSLDKLQPQLENLSKLLVYLEDIPSFEKYKPTTRFRPESETESVVAEDKKVQSDGNIASRFGIKAPQMPHMPQMPQMPQISAPKLKVGGFGGLRGKKSAPKEPEPAKEVPIAAPAAPPPAPVVQKQTEPESLVDEINDWISTSPNVNEVPDGFKGLFKNLQAPNLDDVAVERQKPKTDKISINESTISPNPIMLTTSGIEGVFDIQRVIITMKDPKALRYQVESAVNDSQKISGQCTISTGLSTITVNFSCAASVLGKQLGVCDVVRRALFGNKSDEEADDSTPTRPSLTTGQESDSYYNKLASLSSDLLSKKSQSTVATPSEDTKQDTPLIEGAQSKDFGETEDQRGVIRMLDFVQENNINLIVGEWVLARFTGAEGAKWFLCQLELGSTHSYYGRRIPTDDIDFKNVIPEPGLVGHWGNYMRNKKTELCKIVDVLIQGRIARRYASEVAGKDKENDKEAQMKAEIDDDSDDGDPDPKKGLMDVLKKRGTLLGAELVQNITDMWGERLDEKLSDTVLQQVPKELRAAIMNLNENEDLLPAMFLSGVQVHMF